MNRAALKLFEEWVRDKATLDELILVLEYQTWTHHTPVHCTMRFSVPRSYVPALKKIIAEQIFQRGGEFSFKEVTSRGHIDRVFRSSDGISLEVLFPVAPQS
jgi:hypothetical protein